MRTTGAVRRVHRRPAARRGTRAHPRQRPVRAQRWQPAGRPRGRRPRSARPARQLVELSVPGAQRYIAQIKQRRRAVEPVAAHAGLTPETIAATEVPPYWRTVRDAPRGAGGLRRPRRRVRPSTRPRPHRRHLRRVGIPVRLEHPAGRAQRGLRRRADHDGGRRGTAGQGAARHPRGLRDRRRAAARANRSSRSPSSRASRLRSSPAASGSTASRSAPSVAAARHLAAFSAACCRWITVRRLARLDGRLSLPLLAGLVRPWVRDLHAGLRHSRHRRAEP